MSKISSAHKVQNMNKQITQKLQEILDYCKKHGHQPETTSEFGATLLNINHFIYMRKRKGVSVPDNIPALYAKIRAYPNAATQKRKDSAFKKAEKDIEFKKRYEKIQKLTPYNLQILKFICGRFDNGEKLFKQFINTDIDPIVTKAFLEQFYNVYINADVFSYPNRTRRFIELFTGSYKNDDINEIKQQIQEHSTRKYINQTLNEKEREQLIVKYANKQPLSLKEIGYMFYLTSARIQQILDTARNRFCATFKNLDSLLELYISGDANAFMAQLPEKTADMYKYQKDMKLQDIPTSTLNKVGKGLLSFFHIGKSKE